PSNLVTIKQYHGAIYPPWIHHRRHDQSINMENDPAVKNESIYPIHFLKDIHEYDKRNTIECIPKPSEAEHIVSLRLYPTITNPKQFLMEAIMISTMKF